MYLDIRDKLPHIILKNHQQKFHWDIERHKRLLHFIRKVKEWLDILLHKDELNNQHMSVNFLDTYQHIFLCLNHHKYQEWKGKLIHIFELNNLQM